jgi:wobble nucleotide-excising tRNase
MISRIKKIKNLGLFDDYAWGANLQAFGRYNLVYGWNGSGKTTLSNLFAGLPVGSLAGCPDLEYELEMEDGAAVKNGQSLPTKIRVFNRQYVANNVYTASGKAKPIFILGEENKKIADDIAADEEALAAKSAELRTLIDEARGANTRKDKVFSDIAKTIGLNTSGLAARNYRKPDAERDFGTLSGKTPLSDAEVAANTLELKQQEKPDVSELVLDPLSIEGEDASLAAFLDATVEVGVKLCAQTVESKVIERLRENRDIARWVEDGLALHKTHASGGCEFCGQTLPLERMSTLAGHFNEADKKLKSEIDDLLKMLAEANRAIRGLQPPDKANLYDELQEQYQSAVNQFVITRNALLDQLSDFSTSIEEKKARTTESIALKANLDIASLLNALAAVNSEVNSHNGKTVNFKARKDAARTNLETHYLSTIYAEVKDLEKKISDTQTKINVLRDGDPKDSAAISITGLSDRIKNNRAKISSSHKGCQEINSALTTFLGRDELQFQVEGEGYVLMRGRRLAENLSEGERTAIGFVHFITNLKDQDFNPANGIVVIDDPVSSLDSNSIFQAFAFLKNSVRDAQQVFLMTHNFDFLQLLINWLHSSKQKHGYYMIKNAYSASGERTASIDGLDKLLEKHESEYHYLFKRLYTFETDGTIESVYDVPNIARKVLDTFLMFRVPSGESNYAKLESLRTCFDPNKLTAVYKFTNDQSHITGKGFDPSLVGETQKNVKHLLEMIQAVFPEHYKILVESIGH